MKEDILEKLPGIQRKVILKNYTTYKIGGPAKYFFVAKSKDDLKMAVSVAKELKLPIFILGGGSNLLISDKGFNGLVIKIGILGLEFKENRLSVGAGESLAKLTYLSADKGLTGLEWSGGIPGATVGGSIYGHAQAFGTKISEIIENVEALDLKSLKFINLTKNQCLFGLKQSIFKKNKNLIIVSAILNFKQGNAEEIKSKIKEFLDYRRNRHPINFPSPGSTFVNPEIKITDKNLLKKYPELEGFNKTGIIAAGYLIAKSGLSGKRVGNAEISEKHSNFISNLGNAKAKDVLTLIKLAQKKVKKVFGIELETEIQFVGFGKKVI